MDLETRTGQEVALGVVESIEKGRLESKTPWFLNPKHDLPMDLIKNTCRKMKYSRWMANNPIEGEKWAILQESQLGTDPILSEEAWRGILAENALPEQE